MRTAFLFGRRCARGFQHEARQGRSSFIFFSSGSRRPFFRAPPKRGPNGLRPTIALLTPVAFVKLSEEDNGDGKTPEEHMLEASRAEVQKSIPDNVHGLKRFFKEIWYAIDTYVWEPLATGFRFLHLVAIFVPVITTLPVIWFGSRRKERSDERSGTLWWYTFLVRSMERAGPAFIKVYCTTISKETRRAYDSTAWSMGSLSFRHISSRDVQHNVLPPLKCPCSLFACH